MEPPSDSFPRASASPTHRGEPRHEPKCSCSKIKRRLVRPKKEAFRVVKVSFDYHPYSRLRQESNVAAIAKPARTNFVLACQSNCTPDQSFGIKDPVRETRSWYKFDWRSRTKFVRAAFLTIERGPFTAGLQRYVIPVDTIFVSVQSLH